MQPPQFENSYELVIQIGGIAIALQTIDAGMVSVLEKRYGAYIAPGVTPDFVFRIQLVSSDVFDPEADAEVWLQGNEWHLLRGDFKAEWNPDTHQGTIRQSVNPYSIDSVLRIVHTLLLAREGGFLLHASSAVRNGKSFLFTGLSEAGKTTMVRNAPSDVSLLTDEASYVRRIGGSYQAYGTPFAGELGQPGKNISAPIQGLYFLKKASRNQIEPMDKAQAVRRLMRNILFFAEDKSLVQLVFESACAFVATVPVFELSFLPDQRVWELIG
jgi:hypothetical protein